MNAPLALVSLSLSFLFATAAIGNTKTESRLDKARASLAKAITKLPQADAATWTDYLQLSSLDGDKPSYVAVSDLRCKLDKIENRPEYWAPIAGSKEMLELIAVIRSIDFSKEEIKAAGFEDHAKTECDTLTYAAQANPKPTVPKSKDKPVPTQDLVKSGFGLVDVAYWNYKSDPKTSLCTDPTRGPGRLGFDSSANADAKKCMQQAYSELVSLLSSLPRECAALKTVGGPTIFTITVADLSTSSRHGSCRPLHMMRTPWHFRAATRKPDWAPTYDKGLLVWPAEFFGKDAFDAKGLDAGFEKPASSCRTPTRFDLVRLCAERLQDYEM